MNRDSFRHYAHGKLLLTGEYFVLDGADALAVPTRFGQRFSTFTLEHHPPQLHWKSVDGDGSVWFEGKFRYSDGFYPAFATDDETAARISGLMNAALELSGLSWQDYAADVVTELEFDRRWGLGSSSALVASVAEWFNIDPFELLGRTFGGSGYDVACAPAGGPLFFNNRHGVFTSEPVALPWPFKDELLFAYLGRKQDSRDGIARYREQAADADRLARISAISRALPACRSLDEFMNYLEDHEALVAGHLGLEPVKSGRFPGFEGCVKSLGAWGGDFVLAASPHGADYAMEYFRGQGLETFFRWREIVLE